MYGEEYLQNNSATNSRDDGISHNLAALAIGVDHNTDNDQKSRGKDKKTRF